MTAPRYVHARTTSPEMMAFGIDKESGSIKISPATPKMIIAVDPEDTNPNPWIAVKSKSSKKSDNNRVYMTDKHGKECKREHVCQFCLEEHTLKDCDDYKKAKKSG